MARARAVAHPTSYALDPTWAVAILFSSHRERVMANNGCPSCGGAELRVLPFVTLFSSVAYFRCLTCRDVWCITREESHAQRITKFADKEAPHERAVLFTCPHCGDTLDFDGSRVEEGIADSTVALFSCRGHGLFRFTNGSGLEVATFVTDRA